jgi:hypothetical protein
MTDNTCRKVPTSRRPSPAIAGKRRLTEEEARLALADSLVTSLERARGEADDGSDFDEGAFAQAMGRALDAIDQGLL